MKRPQDLEHSEPWVAELDRELKSLPDHPAPPTLIPRVLAIIEAQQRLPWHAQAWWVWPTWARVVTALASVALVGGLVWAGLLIGNVDRLSGLPNGALGDLVYVAESVVGLIALVVGCLADAVRHTYGAWLLGCGILCGVMYVFCVGLGTACCRLAVRRK